MNIHFQSLPSFPIFFFQENLLDTLTTRQKKILAVASLAFASLAAAYYIATRCCIKAKLQDEEDQAMPGIVLNKPIQEEDETDNPSTEKIEKRVLPNSTVEQGSFLSNKLHGKGMRVYKDGTFEQGAFDHGILVEGIKKNSSGNIVEGKFDQDGFLNGRGKITFPEGTVYEGEFVEDQLCGEGKIIFHSGRVEEGKFKEGYLYGLGKITYPDGRIEQGLFEKSVLMEIKVQ